ncbi:MAG: PKD domain-containing protein [Candidatus Thermoplasmatota archaeon]|nr:PKD domain-containing protein [Candidatus Thermoplasmatota archaeon]
MKKVIRQKKFFSVLTVAVSFLIISSAFTFVEGNGGLKADFYWQPTEPTDLQLVHFYDNSSGGTIVWIWDFGDDNFSCNRNPVHMYGDDGIYIVRLTVWDDNSTMDTITYPINILNVPPVADAGSNRIVNNLTVTFNASSSYDPDGAIVGCAWDFGDGNTASGIFKSHTYMGDNVYTVTLNVTDNDGAYNETSVQIIVDTENPQTNITLDGDLGKNGWYKGNASATLDATDNLSGVNATWYKIEEEWNIYNESFNVSAEGENEVEYYSTDEAGNSEDIKSITVKIDNNHPQTNSSINGSLGNNGWYVGTVTITLNASDALSGVDYTKYKIDDGDWENYGGGVSIGSNGNHTLYFYSVDNAGNVEAEKNFTFKIDKTGPSVSITAPKDGYLYIFGREILPTVLGKTKIIGSFTAAATATDTLSGIQAIYFKLDGQVLWEDFNSPYKAELPREFPFGVHTLTVTAYDGAGNSVTTGEVKYIKIL